MNQIIAHLDQNYRVYLVFITVFSFALLYWLSRYFATKSDFKRHDERIELNEKRFVEHQLEHYKLRDLVHEIDSHVKHLPTAKESQELAKQMSRLEGRLEGLEPLFKQLLNNDNMLIQNELNGEKR